MRSHYAPIAGVELVSAGELRTRAEALLLSGRRVAVVATNPLDLPREAAAFSMPADVTDFGRALYATFREIDRKGFDLILVVPPPDSGLGWAIRDRLIRAASPRR
jgi:L-threonylcarbamoyladenylate synthase